MMETEEKLPQELPEEEPESKGKERKEGETSPKHPPMFDRDKLYRNIPFTVKQMDYIIAGIVAAIVIVLLIGLILR